MPAFIKPSFARGVISPKIYGRVDSAAYQVALRTAKNVVVHASGGVSRRQGLEFIARCKYGPYKNYTGLENPFSDPVLIPFKFNNFDTYILEINCSSTGGSIRFIRGDEQVVTALSGSAITGITNARPAVLTLTSIASLVDAGDEIIISGVNGGGVNGMTEIRNRRAVIGGASGNTATLLNQGVHYPSYASNGYTYWEFDTTTFGTFTSSPDSRVYKVYEVPLPAGFGSDARQLKYVQSGDIITFTHPDGDGPYELRRYGHTSWTLTKITTKPAQINPTSVAGTQNGTTGSTNYKYKVTAIADETFEESLPGTISSSGTITAITKANPAKVTITSHGFVDGDEVYIASVGGMTELNGRRFTVAVVDANNFNLKGISSTNYTTYTSGGTATLTTVKITNGNATLSATNNITLTWSEATGAQRYAVYKEDNGLYGLLGETENLTFKDDGGDTPDLESTPPRFREVFEGTGNAPGAVGYFQQRRIFGGATNTPDSTDFSRTGDHSNFTLSNPARADDAFRVTLSSQEINKILHYVALDHLLAFTTGEEWRIDSGDNNRFSIDTVRLKPQSRWGSSDIKPIIVGRIILFVQENKRVVRSIGYELSVDGYTGTDMTLLSDHIFKDSLMKSWAVGISPDARIYIVKEDGSAAVLTFNPEQEVIAWTTWELGRNDRFLYVAVTRPTVSGSYSVSSEKEDIPFFVVERDINGTAVRQIERLAPGDFKTAEDGFFLDGGTSYEETSTIFATYKMHPIDAEIGAGPNAKNFAGVVVGNPVKINIEDSWANGDEIEISGVKWEPVVDAYGNETQPDQLNGHRYKIKDKVDDGWGVYTFTLTDLDDVEIDGSSWKAWAGAYIDGEGNIAAGEVRKAVSTITGLHHLSGETVDVVADGVLLEDQSISADGTLTLASKAVRVHIGFPYISEIETLDIELPGQGGTLQGRLKNVHEVMIRVRDTKNLLVGPNKNNLNEAPWQEFAATQDSTELKTGDVFVTIDPDWNSNGRFLIRQKDPFPMSISAIVPKMEVEGLQEE